MRHLILAAVLASLVVACRQSSEPSARTPASSSLAQRLVSATISDPKTFNPLLVVDGASAAAVGDLFEGLARLNPVTIEMEPRLAEKWEISADGTVYTFHLRHDVRWHDGVALTAADVAFTFDAIFDDRVPNSSKHTLLIDGQRVKTEIADDFTIRLILPRPFAPLINALGFDILPKHILGPALQNGTFAQSWGIDTPPEQIIGTGPYRMARYVPAQFIEFRRNPDYWMKDDAGKPLPYLDIQTVLVVPNQDTMYLKFLSGQTDAHSPRPEEVGDLRAKADELKIVVQDVGLDTGSQFVAFNRNPQHFVQNGKADPRLTWFTDPNFLKALAHAIDKQSMIVNCLNGYGKPAVAEISPENKLYHNPNLQDYAYDLDEARRLLKEGGYIDRNGDGVIEDGAGNPIEFTLNTNAGNQVRERMCSMLKEDWTKLGMKVNYRPLEFTTLVEKLDHTFDWDAVLIGFTGTTEPNNGANMLRSSGNLHLWNPNQPAPATPWEAEIDKLLDQGSGEIDVQKRPSYYWRIQEILHQQLPLIETVRATQFSAYKRSIQNFRPTVWGLYRPELIRIAE
ncbi:MAG TPA: ABC transporter substrate-binding protein [Candidatus Binatia bacterium]